MTGNTENFTEVIPLAEEVVSKKEEELTQKISELEEENLALKGQIEVLKTELEERKKLPQFSAKTENSADSFAKIKDIFRKK